MIKTLGKTKWRRATSLIVNLVMVATIGLAALTAAFAQPNSRGNAATPQITDFNMVAETNKFTTNGDIIKYTISFTMPSNLEGYDEVRIRTASSTELQYVLSGTTIKIEDGAAQNLFLSSPPILILNSNSFGGDFNNAKGLKIVITLQFRVSGWISGKAIKHGALLTFKPVGDDYPFYPDATAEETISPRLWDAGPVSAAYTADGAAGNPPVDTRKYTAGEEVTVLGNVGGPPPLEKPGYTLIGWERDVVEIVLVSEYESKELGPDFTITGTGEPGYGIRISYYDNGILLTQTAIGYNLTQEKATVGADGRWEYTIPRVFGNETFGLDMGWSYIEPYEETFFYEPGDKFVMPHCEATLRPVWEPSAIVGPPSDVFTVGAFRRIGLFWENAGEGGAVRYEVKCYPADANQSVIDATEWINILLEDLTYLPGINKYYYMFRNLDNGTEYMFEVRAYDSAGTVGPKEEVTGAPNPLGNIGGDETDLISIYGINVMPAGGWPEIGGTTWYDAYLNTITMPITIPVIFASTGTIIVSTDATFEMYSDPAFINKESMINRVGANGIEVKTVYIKVTSGNQENWRYYAIMILP